MKKPTIWFDMDGVLAKHCSDDYDAPDYNYLKDGYYRNLEIDVRAEKLFNEALEQFDDVYILTSLNQNMLLSFKWEKDKREWVKEHFPDFPMPHLHITMSRKADVAKAVLGRELTAFDILVDDWNDNLHYWTEHGGTAVKYLNASNSKDSWPYWHIPRRMSVKNAITFLKNFAGGDANAANSSIENA